MKEANSTLLYIKNRIQDATFQQYQPSNLYNILEIQNHENKFISLIGNRSVPNTNRRLLLTGKTRDRQQKLSH